MTSSLRHTLTRQLSSYCPAFRLTKTIESAHSCVCRVSDLLYSPHVYTQYVTLSGFVTEHDLLASMHSGKDKYEGTCARCHYLLSTQIHWRASGDTHT